MRQFYFKRNQKALLFALILWASGISWGFLKLFIYSSTPGSSATPSPSWPSNSTIPLSKTQPTLILFAHSQCPCTLATIGELEKLLAKAPHRVNVFVEFFVPKSPIAQRTKGALWDKTIAIPEVHVREDSEGREAKIFGAETSGQVFLFNTEGALVFHGGITPARGHSGDNWGSAAILDFILSSANSPSGAGMKTVTTKVFGCSLKSADGNRLASKEKNKND